MRLAPRIAQDNVYAAMPDGHAGAYRVPAPRTECGRAVEPAHRPSATRAAARRGRPGREPMTVIAHRHVREGGVGARGSCRQTPQTPAPLRGSRRHRRHGRWVRSDGLDCQRHAGPRRLRRSGLRAPGSQDRARHPRASGDPGGHRLRHRLQGGRGQALARARESPAALKEGDHLRKRSLTSDYGGGGIGTSPVRAPRPSVTTQGAHGR